MTIQYGERYAYSRITDTWYRVTAWEECGEGKIQAKNKEPVEPSDVPDEWREAISTAAE